jgi:hypothetical protein
MAMDEHDKRRNDEQARGVDSPETGPSVLGASTDEARRILAFSAEMGLALRLMGGVAVHMRCPSASRIPLARGYADIDFAGLSRERGALSELFRLAGYEPHAEFNALHGQHRQFYWNPELQCEADVFLDTFTMCHTMDFRARLSGNDDTLPLVDLLLLKLQVVETNVKDYKDALALLVDHRIAPDGIDGDYAAEYLAADWGWWRTATLVLERVGQYAGEMPEFHEAATVERKIGELQERIARQPKSRRWKLRARVGERKRWYELPEESLQLE